MKNPLRAALFVLLAAAQPAIASGVYLSFYGHQSTPIGQFNEFTDTVLVLDRDGMLGPEFVGSVNYFGYLSRNHQSLGYDLPDTNSDPGCLGYDVTAWFEPGAVIIGHVNGSGDQNASLEGSEWLGHVPEDFTHIRIQYQAGHPCDDDARSFLLPVVWVSQPVGVHVSTWGSIKALYR